MPFDWTAITDRNRADLARLVALLFAMAGMSARYVPLRVSKAVRCGVFALLRPAESALRRLIVIAARGLEVPLRAVRAMPEGGIERGVGARMRAFALFDRRRIVLAGVDERCAGRGPQIRGFDGDYPAAAPRDFTDEVNAAPLARRLARLQRALERLPHEARRLARWRARHPAALKRPMRPGRPPGHRERAADFAQEVLRETQMMALWALEPETA